MAPPTSSSTTKVFGQSTHNNKRSKPMTKYQRQFGSGVGRGGSSSSSSSNPTTQNQSGVAEQRRIRTEMIQSIEEKFGIEQFVASSSEDHHSQRRQRRGWLYNLCPTTVTAADPHAGVQQGAERSGLDLYFYSEESSRPFKSTVLYRPYFYVLPDCEGVETTTQLPMLLELIASHLVRLFESAGLYHVETVYKQDLDQPNHLSPSRTQGRPLLKLIFDNTSQLIEARNALAETIAKFRQQKRTAPSIHADGAGGTDEPSAGRWLETLENPLQCLMDLREHDVPYVVRVCTDLDIRAGTWYTVVATNTQGTDDNDNNDDDGHEHGGIQLLEPDRERKADVTFLAFDIECTKAPLKFPNAQVDEIFMISYMVSTPTGGPQGYLIVSRHVVSTDVQDFEYTPQSKYPGPFHIFNEPDEASLLKRFFAEYQRHCPQIVVTYNGDFFDWPFLQARAQIHGLDLWRETGIDSVSREGTFRGRFAVHLDAFHWVQRDSYLPQGAQGLKAVTKYKLGYDPVEVDPEDMVKFAREKPVHMATYSVSDAVATYYLYEKYVHLFIFSLSTIIPMGPEDVLCKGSGTLCEMLLMVEACRKDVLCPNKQTDPLTQFHNGHLLESETYIGGKVECLETGVYRSDIEYEFDLKPSAFQELIQNIDRDLTFAIEVEGGTSRKGIVNYDQIRNEIVQKLELLRDRPKRVEKPYIYHLDVGAMYPNIILTNRLQPSAIVHDATCAACDYNQSKNNCKRRLDWVWRGEFSPATRAEYERTRDQLSREIHRDGLTFAQLPENERASLIKNRLKTYSNKAYRKTKVTEEEMRPDIVCMRENDFYVDTVRQFRDRRYEYKKLNKEWKKKVSSAKDPATKKECEDRVLVYDSLQVAHKCILNSFYGYVMRKGARWRSMEMAGIVTKIGADIITQARMLVEQIGRPLELDTDGIWCILPVSFPDVYSFELEDGSKLKLEYPCVMLNAAVHDKFTNHQYQTVVDPKRGLYETRSECSIFFEVDGPYRCMVLPASTEEGKLLKKRYAVFNFDGSLAELKGFELKRRGELELIKTFQSQVFERFLEGETLKECYDAVADVANHWIDVIDTRGESLDDHELIDLISENRSMSRQLDDYGDQKGTSQTTARRLGEFLGSEIIKDKGLNCKFIIAEQPFGAPVTERAIPTAIWKAERTVMKHYLRKWLKSPGLDGHALDIRNVLDWDYYLDRLGKTIQKIITIPAALQQIPNPVPRVDLPIWLETKVSRENDRFQQQSIRKMFGPRQSMIENEQRSSLDIEDIGGKKHMNKVPVVHKMRRPGFKSVEIIDDQARDMNVERIVLSKENVSDWLQQKKLLWRKARKEKRLASTDDKFNMHAKQRKNLSMEGFVRQAAQTLAENEWQILEVREMSTYDSQIPGTSSGSGDFLVWIMVGDSSPQKITVRVPRIIHIATRKEIMSTSAEILEFRQVEKHLPHNKSASYLYEVTMTERLFKSKKWLDFLRPTDGASKIGDAIETMYESATPLLTRILSHLGNIAKIDQRSKRAIATKSYMLTDLAKVDRPSEGEYLHHNMTYKRLFLYVRINQKTRTGLVALFIMKSGSGSVKEEIHPVDLTRPSEAERGSFGVDASCHLWIIKPNARNAQRNVSLKQVDTMFAQLLETIQEAVGVDSEYACVSQKSVVDASGLKFVDTETLAYAGANEIINNVSKTGPGATVILLNSSRPTNHLRRYMSTFSSHPVLSAAFPPGPAHDPKLNTLPSLNWEQPAAQLSFEAYLFMTVISFPKRVAYCRYGHVPLGNLGEDEKSVVYDVSLARLLQKNRALSWANQTPGRPDVGVSFMSLSEECVVTSFDSSHTHFSQDEIWGDDDELVSPVIRRPGCYRSICVDIDIQDLAIAAMTEVSSAVAPASSAPSGNIDLNSPTSVSLFDPLLNSSKASGPLGDEMSTVISLPIVRALVAGWLKDAFTTNSLVADELLHHIYRLLSNPETLFHDPALYRIVHSLMKSTFFRLLGELRRLGCSIAYASFQRVVLVTNKLNLSDAEEYINFVLDTARRQTKNCEHGDALTKISLRPRQFHSNLVFLDEYNFGTMQLERINKDEVDESIDFKIPDPDHTESVIVAQVVTAWSVMNYLGSEIAQEYFRAIIGRFSKDVLRKQMTLATQDDVLPIAGALGITELVVQYKKKMISTHFAHYLTRAVGEIMKDGPSDDMFPPVYLHKSRRINPALEFIKIVIAVLELDSDVEQEVHVLKRSMLAQVGVAEYNKAAHWVNPCPTFVLPDVFCAECCESRDVNLCYVPPRLADEEFEKHWACVDCGTTYNVNGIEKRLLHLVHKKMVRYVLQDVRCAKTNRVATRALSPLSECSAGLKLDIQPNDAENEMRLLQSLAEFHELDTLKETVSGLLSNNRQMP